MKQAWKILGDRPDLIHMMLTVTGKRGRSQKYYSNGDIELSWWMGCPLMITGRVTGPLK
ncbi:hypothetical protein NEUTE2DRAFT_83140, partial [Neurospora tetrasperma FGSC 2509]